DGDLGDRWMRGHDAFDLGRVAIEAAADVQVLQAVGDAQVAAGVEVADVAGVQPAVRVDGLAGRRVVVEIGLHHVVAAYDNLAGLAGAEWTLVTTDTAQLDAGDRLARGQRDRLGIVVRIAQRDHAAGLGETVAGEHDLEAEFGARALDQARRDRRGAGDR